MEQQIEIYTDYIDDEGFVQRYNYEKGYYYNTGVCLKGAPGRPGRPGKDGLTPHIGENGNWWIGDIDTQVPSAGSGGSISLKTINGESIEGSGNIAIKSYHTFNNWTDNSTTEAFCQSIVNDNTTVAGMTYLGKLYCSDLPGGLIQGEAIVEIIAQDSNGKNIHIILNSSNTEPYRWEYHYCKINEMYTTDGWKGYQLEINSTNKLDYSLLKNTPTIPEAQVQSNWNESNNTSKAYIQNKPAVLNNILGITNPTVNGNYITVSVNTPLSGRASTDHFIINFRSITSGNDSKKIKIQFNGENNTYGLYDATGTTEITVEDVGSDLWYVDVVKTNQKCLIQNKIIISDNLSNYIQTSQTAGLVKNDGTIDTNTYLTQVPNTCVTSSTSGLKLEVVSALPANPDANTIYIVQ